MHTMHTMHTMPDQPEFDPDNLPEGCIVLPPQPPQPVLTRLRYDKVPLTRAQALNLRQCQVDHMTRFIKGAKDNVDALTMARTKLRQRPLDTHRTVTVELEPGDPGYDVASPVTTDDALGGTFAWVEPVHAGGHLAVAGEIPTTTLE